MSLNILLVDDSIIVRSVIKKALMLANIPFSELFEANDGVEALKILKSDWVDLVFTDINMPVMNGVELITNMQEDDIMASIPVVVISTEGSETRIRQLQEKGIDRYIRKPFTPEDIKNAVEDVLGILPSSDQDSEI